MRMTFGGSYAGVIGACVGGQFLDGYFIAAAGFIIADLYADPSVSVEVASLVAAAYALGALVGAGLLSGLADYFGRRSLLLGSMSVIAVSAIGIAGIGNPYVLVAGQFVLGMMLGADMPAGQAMVTEFVDPARRTSALTTLMCGWFVGALFAVGAIFALKYCGAFWPSIFAVGAVLAGGALVLRYPMPESELWRHVRRRRLLLGQWREMYRSATARRAVVFCSFFWLCQIIPVSVMMFYAPMILGQLTGTNDVYVHLALLYAFFLVGVLPAGRVKDRFIGYVLWGSFAVMGSALIGFALFGEKLPTVTAACFICYALAYGLQTSLNYVLPNRMFETELRSCAVGFVGAISRIGSITCVLAVPHLLLVTGAQGILLLAAIVSFAGVICVRLLPAEFSAGARR